MAALRSRFLPQLKLRGKLSAAFFGLSALIGVSGACGLWFVHNIGATVSVFADVTSPLLGQTVELVDNAQRMRTTFLTAMGSGRIDDSPARALADLDVEARHGIDNLRRLFAQEKL